MSRDDDLNCLKEFREFQQRRVWRWSRLEAPLWLVGTILLYVLVVWMLTHPARGAEIRPPVMPKGAATSAAQTALGYKLFFDRRLSRQGTKSCADCHLPDQGFSDGKRVSDGVNGRTTRNAPTLINAAYAIDQFGDGRAAHFEGQADQVLKNQVEMGNANTQQVANRLSGIPAYRASFRQAFGRDVDRNPADVLLALAAFERTIVSTDAPIDHALEWHYEGGRWIFTRKDMREFSRDRRRQLDVFLAKCSSCHCGSDYRNWTEPFKVEFANTGVARQTGTNDLGRGPVANDDSKNRAFKIPTLREIAKSGPWFHQGQAPTIKAVLNHYRNPGNDPLLDPRIRSLRLTDQDVEDLAAFLPWAFAGNYPHIEAPAALTTPLVLGQPSPLGPQPVDDGGRRGFRLRGRR